MSGLPASSKSSDRELIALLPPGWWRHLITGQLVEFSARVVFLLLLAWLIGDWVNHNQPASPALLLAGVLAIALRWLGHRASLGHAAAGTRQITEQLFQRALNGALQPAPRIQRQTHDGDTALALSRQTEHLRPYWQGFLPALSVAAIQPLLLLLLIAYVDWLAGLLLLFAAPLIPLFTVLIGMGTAQLARQEHLRLARLSGFFLDRLQALPTLRLFAAIDNTRAQVRAATEGLRQSSMRVLRVAFLSSAVLEFLAAISIATLAIYVGLSLLGAFTLGPAPQMDLTRGLIILLLAPEFFAPLRTLAQRYHDRASALSAAPEVLQLANLDSPAVHDGEPPRHAPAIELSHLSAGWPGNDAPVINGLDLHVDAGEWLTIYGPSGIGKSTLASVLAGHLQPSAGHYRLDNQPMHARRLRTRVGWLDQQPSLLPGSLLHNLTPGDPEPDPARLAQVIESTGLESIIDALPQGLHSRIGQDGHQLSGGEAQRVALARALYPGARLLVLDEPASRLDNNAEAQLLAVLRGLAGSHTIVLFSHSPAARSASDRCIDLEQAS